MLAPGLTFFAAYSKNTLSCQRPKPSPSRGAEKGAEEADERGDRRPAPPRPPAAKRRLTACASRLCHQTAPSTPWMLCSRNDLRTVVRREIGRRFVPPRAPVPIDGD